MGNDLIKDIVLVSKVMVSKNKRPNLYTIHLTVISVVAQARSVVIHLYLVFVSEKGT